MTTSILSILTLIAVVCIASQQANALVRCRWCQEPIVNVAIDCNACGLPHKPVPVRFLSTRRKR